MIIVQYNFIIIMLLLHYFLSFCSASSCDTTVEGKVLNPGCRHFSKTYFKCYDSQDITPLKCTDGDSCNTEDCCGKENNVEARSLRNHQYAIPISSYNFDYDSMDLDSLFKFEGTNLQSACFQYQHYSQQIASDDSNENFNQRIKTHDFSIMKWGSTQRLIWSNMGGFQIKVRPQEGPWEYSQVYMTLMNSEDGFTYVSEKFKIKYECDRDGYIAYDYEFPGDKTLIATSEIRLEFKKGIIGCVSTPLGSTQIWTITNPSGFFDMASVTQTDTHLSVAIAAPFSSHIQVGVGLQVLDSNGLTYDQTKTINYKIECGQSSTNYTEQPDSSAGMLKAQRYQIHSTDTTAQFVYKDPISSLLQAHPQSDCVIQTREIFALNDSLLTSFGPFVQQLDGSFTLQYLGNITVKSSVDFKIKLKDKGNQVFWVQGLNFQTVCGLNSNIVTSGPYVEATYTSMTASGFQHSIGGFTESASGICSIDGYQITDLTIQVYNMLDQLEGTLTENIAISSSSGMLLLQFQNHADFKRVYTFKVQGKTQDLLLHTTNLITVTSLNNMTILQPNNATYMNQSGSIIYTIPKQNFILENPNILIASFAVKNLVSEIHHENGTSLGTTAYSHTLDTSGVNLTLTLPPHCDFARSFTFKILAQTNSGQYSQTMAIQIDSYNNQTVDLQKPIELTLYQFSTSGGSVDISKYFFISEPLCKIKQMLTLDDITEIDSKGVLKVTDTSELTQVQTQVLVTWSEQLVFSFNPRLVLDLHIIQAPKDGPGISVNIKPQFEQSMEDLFLEVNNKNEQFEIAIPEIFDEDPSTVTIDIISGFDDSFMTFADGKFLFDRFSQTSSGEYTLVMRLEDLAGNFNEESWKVTIQYLQKEENQESQQKQEKQELVFENLEIQETEIIAPDGREAIQVFINEIDSNGRLYLSYSEEIHPIEHYGLNLTNLNDKITDVLSIKYNSKIPNNLDANQKFPELVKYKVLNFTSQLLVVKLEFKNPLYVSSYGSKDTLDVTFDANYLFSSVLDGFSLATNYTLERIEVPAQMASQEDYDAMQSLGSSAQNSMLLTLIVPFLFMLFMSASMDRVWSFYNMLQLSTNLLHFNSISIPANNVVLMAIIKNVTYFSLFKDKHVQDWLQKYIFGKAQTLQNIVFGQGNLVTCAVLFTMTMLFVQIGLKIKAVKSIAQKVKNKMMWSSFFRGSIQTYFPTALMMFGILKSLNGEIRLKELDESFNERRLAQDINYEWIEKELELTDYFTLVFKLTITLLLPLFSYNHIKDNYDMLNDVDFKKQFITLYNQLKHNQSSVYLHTCFFLSRRLFLSLITVFMNDNLVLHIYFNTFSSLFMMHYFYKHSPYCLKILNQFEKMNEIFTFFLVYSLLIYSDFVQSPEPKYIIGWCYVGLFLLITVLNITIVFYDLVQEVRIDALRKKNQKKWEEYNQMVEKMVKFIIYNEQPHIQKQKIKNEVLAYKNYYCFTELQDKIIHIFEQREAQKNTQNEEFSFGEYKETQKLEEGKAEDCDPNTGSPNLQDWHQNPQKFQNPILIDEGPYTFRDYGVNQIGLEIEDEIVPQKGENLVQVLQKIADEEIAQLETIQEEKDEVEKAQLENNQQEKIELETIEEEKVDQVEHQVDESQLPIDNEVKSVPIDALKQHRETFDRLSQLCKTDKDRQKLQKWYMTRYQQLFKKQTQKEENKTQKNIPQKTEVQKNSQQTVKKNKGRVVKKKKKQQTWESKF